VIFASRSKAFSLLLLPEHFATMTPDTHGRACRSLGHSESAIYDLVARAVAKRCCRGRIVDIGCGGGALWSRVQGLFSRYIGVDLVSYPGFPAGQSRVVADLQAGAIPLVSHCADVVTAVEVIEHLENPRAFMRELVRLVRPNGWVVVTTPNQRSALSVLTLLARGRFAAFQDCNYPTHLTALLEVDLRRIAAECGLVDAEIHYTAMGRVPMMSRHYPCVLARRFPAALSDNVLLIARAPLL
jgi:2-polyprenyl-3-methyl-5-hydroxy-6-metoxy-1,4-benzoquinol methylase